MPTDHARIAYDALAPAYDDFNAANDYELWFSALLPRLEEFGLGHGALLDVGCGTGRAFEPMLRRGWRVTGCDVSPGMVEQARAKDLEVELHACDMRDLPVYGSFELVWALNDPVNYLLTEDDLDIALARMGANLADDGLLVFDCNTTRGMEALFGVSESDARFSWEGFGGDAEDLWAAELSGESIPAHLHRERYWPVAEIQSRLRAVGLVPIAALGQRDDDTSVAIDPDWDEAIHNKVIHIARP